MVGKMVKLKCRVKLDHLKLGPPRPPTPPPPEEVEPEQEDVKVEGEGGQVKGEVVVMEELMVPSEDVTDSTSVVIVRRDEVFIPEGVVKKKKAPSPHFPRKLRCRVVVDPRDVKPASREGFVTSDEVEIGGDAGGVDLIAEPSVVEAEPKLEPIVEPKLEPIVEPKLEPIVEPELESIVEPKLESIVEPESEPAVKPETVVASAATVEPLTEAPVEPEPETPVAVEPEFKTPVKLPEDLEVKFVRGVVTPTPAEEDDISGSILELEQDEISTPKGPRKNKIGQSPSFPKNPSWVKPEDLLEELWEKKKCLKSKDDDPELFVFPTDPNIVLSPHGWQLPDLMALKKELNSVKSSLDLYPLDHWHSHTKKMNIANLIMSYVKRYFNPEFSSQAWGKMFEILCAYEVIPAKLLDEIDDMSEERRQAGEKVAFDSVHLCEAPGAFISALNHFVKISYEYMDWNWLATTLNPYHESNDVGKMINDDRLILVSMDKWTFLEDMTGNIVSQANMKHLIAEKVSKLDQVREEKTGAKGSSVYLVTADGSIDCQSNPGEQEALVSHLQFAEILTALMILEEGGSFILKIFTFLEATTICHLYLLSCLFKEVHLFKPATSKEGNSEVYVICLEYLGKTSIESILEDKLIPNLETYDKLLKEGKLLLPISAIPDVFIDRIKESARFFCNYQMKIIRRNSSCFPCDTRMYLVMKPFRKEAAEEWIEWCQIKALPTKLRLFTGDADDFRMNKASHVDLKREQGCFADKVLRLEGTDLQKLQGIKTELVSYDELKGPYNQVLYGSTFKVGPIQFERPYKNIRCSRFCYGRILSCRQELRDIVQNYLTDLQALGLGNMDSICSGHCLKRIYESMAKSCDMERKNLEVLCFSKLTWDYVTKSDFTQQKEDLNKLFSAVQDMGKDRSMFLCRFPMLTRLQTGLIFCLASVFHKIIIYADPVKNVIGIMLHKFKGLSQPEDKNMFRCITGILEVLEDNNFNWPVLKMVPMKTLLEFMPTEFLVTYNMLILCQDMLRTVNVVECTIQTSATRRFTKKSRVLLQ